MGGDQGMRSSCLAEVGRTVFPPPPPQYLSAVLGGTVRHSICRYSTLVSMVTVKWERMALTYARSILSTWCLSVTHVVCPTTANRLQLPSQAIAIQLFDELLWGGIGADRDFL